MEYHYDITDSDIKRGSGAEIQLTATYNISVYATKNGYNNSNTATATLCWIEQEPKTEGLNDDIESVRAQAVLIKNTDGIITINGIDDGTRVSVYSLNGAQESSILSRDGTATLYSSAKSGSTIIVKIGNKSVKVLIN